MDKDRIETLFKNRLWLRLENGYTPEGSTVPTLAPHPKLKKLSVEGIEQFYTEVAKKIAELFLTQGMDADSLINNLVDQFTDLNLRTPNPSKAESVTIRKERFNTMFAAAIAAAIAAAEQKAAVAVAEQRARNVGSSQKNQSLKYSDEARLREALRKEEAQKQQAMDGETDPLRKKMIELFDNPNVPLNIGTEDIRDLINGNAQIKKLQITNPGRANEVVQQVLADICNNVHVGLFSSQDTRSRAGVSKLKPMNIPANLAHNVIKSGQEDGASVAGQGDAYVKTLLDRKIAAVIKPPQLAETKGEEEKSSQNDGSRQSQQATRAVASKREARAQLSVNREKIAQKKAMEIELDPLKKKLLELGFDGSQRVEIATGMFGIGVDLRKYIDKQPDLAKLYKTNLGAANRVRESIVADIATNITKYTFGGDTRRDVDTLVMSPETLAGLIKYPDSDARVQTDIKEDNGIEYKTRSFNIKELLAGKVAEEIRKDTLVQKKNQRQNGAATVVAPAVLNPAQDTPANTAATVTQVEPQDPLTDNVLAAMAKANQQAKPKQMIQGLAIAGGMKVAKAISVVSKFNPMKFFKKSEEAKVTTPPATPGGRGRSSDKGR